MVKCTNFFCVCYNVNAQNHCLYFRDEEVNKCEFRRSLVRLTKYMTVGNNQPEGQDSVTRFTFLNYMGIERNRAWKRQGGLKRAGKAHKG